MGPTVNIIFEGGFVALSDLAYSIGAGIRAYSQDINFKLIPIDADGYPTGENKSTESVWAAEGFALGMSSKTNTIPSSMKACMDRSLAEFMDQSLSGKPVTLFFCSEGMYDVVALACVTFLAHQGAIFVPLGYPTPGVIEVQREPHGISPWGAGAVEQTGASAIEHKVARKQGLTLANILFHLI